MRKSVAFLVVLFLCALVTPAQAGVDLGVSIGDEGLRGFYLAVGEHYRVPEKEVLKIKKRHIPDEEIPVVLFIAKKARVAPSTVIDLRLRGMSWMDITLRFGLNAEIFYVPVRVGPPYGKAYGYYLNKPKKKWKRLKFTDAEVVNLVNLRFISEHYGYSAEEVMKLREKGKNFVVIHGEVKKIKRGKAGIGQHRGKGGKGKKR